MLVYEFRRFPKNLPKNKLDSGSKGPERTCSLVLAPKEGFAGAMFAMNIGSVAPCWCIGVIAHGV